MNWTKKDKARLLKCETDEELKKSFPALTLESARRMQRLFRPKRKAGGRIHRAIILPDIHYPLHDEPSWNAVLEFVPFFKPDEIVLLGDALEMQAIDHWKEEKGNRRAFENKRLKKEYEGFIQDILEPLEKLAPKAKKVYMGGNHEDWASQLVDRQPQMEGFVEPEIVMHLADRGWQWIPYLIKQSGRLIPGTYKIGKLTFTHGQYTNKYHAAKMSDCYDRSVAYGHTHDVQLYTKVHAEDPNDFHSAQSIGCLCNLSPGYLWGRPNRWVHSFGAMYVQPDGKYNLYVPIIIDGKFVFEGKPFGN